MSLHLISVLIHAAEEVCAAVHVEHNPLSWISGFLPLGVISAHLDPFRLQGGAIPPPLPPLLAAHAINPMGTQLTLNGYGGLGDRGLRNQDILRANPMRGGNPLRRKRLKLLDRVVRSVDEEGADQV